MKTIILVGLSVCTAGYTQKTNTLFGPGDIAPMAADDLALYPGKNIDLKHAPLKNPKATYHYKGKDYYIQPSENGYIMHTSKKNSSYAVMHLKDLIYGNGFLLIDDTGNSFYANFDKKSDLIIEFYDRKTKKVKQLKIAPKIIKSH